MQENHIVRSESFWWQDPVTMLNDYTVGDNGQFIVASVDHAMFNAETCWLPYIVEDRNGEPDGIYVQGRVYWLRQMCDMIEGWADKGLITLYQMDVLGELIKFLIHAKMGWDLNYHFPCLYVPQVSEERLQIANIKTFVTQFPSDPYSVILDGSESVETFALTSVLSFDMDMEVFDWETLNDSLNSLVDED